MTVIRSLFYSIIDVNILINFWERLFIDFRKSLILINDVIYSTVFLLKLLIVIVIIFVVFKLIILTCSLIIIHLRLLRVVRSVYTFVSLIIQLISSVLIKLIIWVWIWVCIFDVDCKGWHWLLFSVEICSEIMTILIDHCW